MNNKMDRMLTVLYGSQTGTAEDIAEKITRDAKRRHYDVTVTSLDDYQIKSMSNERVIILVCATTGQGEEPDNMKHFWGLIMRKGVSQGSLTGVRFAMLGLGDSSYEKYNFVAKKLYRRFVQLGAEPLMDLGLSDEQHDLGIDGLALPWMTELWNNLDVLFPLPEGLDIISVDTKPPSRFKLIYLNENQPTTEHYLNANSLTNTSKYLYHNVKIISNQRVTHVDHFQDVRRIKFNLEGTGLQFQPGDVLVVKPQNLQDHVESFLTHMGLDPDVRFILEGRDTSCKSPCLNYPTTIRHVVENYFDINSIPKRSLFELMIYFAENDLERDRLTEFSSSAEQEQLFSYCNRPRKTILEVFQDFPHTSRNIPLEYFFDIIPAIKPRYFSIASSILAYPGEAEILMAVVKYKTKLFYPRLGICSNFLASLDPTEKETEIPVTVKKGSITFPRGGPIIMVGPGTGCAPFRSLIQDRVCRGVGLNYLFFGCRFESKDYLCREEWEGYVRMGLLNIYTAFSRDQPSNTVYVQHKLTEHSPLIWYLINNRGAYFFVAGNSKQMPNDVLNSLKDIFTSEGGLTAESADEYLKNLQKQKRVQLETWA